jgi:hypothetical protein
MVPHEPDVPWYKRSMLAPVWVTLALAAIFGGMLVLMRLDIEHLGAPHVASHQEAQPR